VTSKPHTPLEYQILNLIVWVLYIA